MCDDLALRCGDLEDKMMLLQDEVNCAEEVIQELRSRIITLEKTVKRHKASIRIMVLYA